MRSAPTLVCELGASRLELVAIVLVAFAALCAPWATPLGAGWRLALSAAVVVAVASALRALRRRTWTGLALSATGAVVLRRADGPEWSGRLEHAAVIGPLIVLELRQDAGARLRLPLYPDSTDRDSLRRLRVLLRHGWRAEPGDAIR